TVRFDMRGHGQSACPDGFEWSITSMIGDLEAVIDASTTGPVHLVGESIGGTVALAFAMTYPSRVRTLTICNGAHAGASVRNLDDWAELMGKGGMIAWSAMMMERRFHRGSIPRAAWEWFETQQATANPTAIMDAVKVLVGTDLSADFGRLTMPTLLMHPDASPFIPVSLMAEMRDLLPDARLQVFAHARHGLPFSHAEACASLLSSFLAEAS
ncbi:MAG: alpha/beta hydrolase, partial [Chromatiales bacterium]|nr:alpha/beta hydrolase [Chromatiales bacterium]